MAMALFDKQSSVLLVVISCFALSAMAGSGLPPAAFVNIVDSTTGELVNFAHPAINNAGSVEFRADLNDDGELNFFDVSAFLVAFNTMDPIADFTGDGMYNFFDVSAFLTSFNMGCP